MERGVKEVLLEYSWKCLSALMRVLWVLLNNFYCIPVHTLLIVLASPLTLVSKPLFYRFEETLFTWILSMVSCWCYSVGFQIAESGDSLDDFLNNKLLFMPNHQSTADVPFLMTIFAPRIGFSGRIMWLMDKIFKYTNFGVVSWLHGDFFIQAGKENREQSLSNLRTHLQDVFVERGRDCLVLFPEGGFLRNRKEVSKSFAKKRDLPDLEYCTIPRTGALDVIIKAIGPSGHVKQPITKVVDVTIAYPEEGKPLDLVSIFTGWTPPTTTHVHYRVFDVKDIPTESEALFTWMVKLYEEKNRMLAEFYSSGVYPHTMFDPKANPPTVLEHNPRRYLFLHVFFLSATTVASLSFIRLYSLFF